VLPISIASSKQGMKGDNVKEFKGKPQLELLRGINGAFRPGVLTCLMGVSGAGKTTLMDVLAGRKTSEILSRIGNFEKTCLPNVFLPLRAS